MHKLAGNGLAWYPINQMVKVGSRDIADTDSMAEGSPGPAGPAGPTGGGAGFRPGCFGGGVTSSPSARSNGQCRSQLAAGINCAGGPG
jgi:hypothetical protein